MFVKDCTTSTKTSLSTNSCSLSEILRDHNLLALICDCFQPVNGYLYKVGIQVFTAVVRGTDLQFRCPRTF